MHQFASSNSLTSTETSTTRLQVDEDEDYILMVHKPFNGAYTMGICFLVLNS